MRVLIAFMPSRKMRDNISKVRKIIGIKVEKNSGLKTPHMTIIDNSYSDVKKVDKELGKIAKFTKPFVAKIKGLDTFVVNKKLKIEKYKQNPLIYLIKNNPAMNKFRRDLLIQIDSLKTKERLKQWMKENPEMSKKGLVNVEKYGTAFGLREWKFHTTIGLIPKIKQKEILERIHKLNIQDNWEINHFGLFVRKNGWVLFKKYYFKKK